MIAVVALIVVGPHKLPGVLRSLGQWVRKLRRLTTEVRAQTGIDELLREEGIQGGLTELRGMLRGEIAAARAHQRPADPYIDAVELDLTREYPPEGVDAYGALPEDLLDDDDIAESSPPARPDAAQSDAAQKSLEASPNKSETAV